MENKEENPVVETAVDSPVLETASQSSVHWDDSKMVTHFSNVVNIQSTLEQIDLLFGTNKTWSGTPDRQVEVELTNRVILSPHAAKRLWSALGGVLKEHEKRYGQLDVR